MLRAIAVNILKTTMRVTCILLLSNIVYRIGSYLMICINTINVNPNCSIVSFVFTLIIFLLSFILSVSFIIYSIFITKDNIVKDYKLNKDK